MITFTLLPKESVSAEGSETGSTKDDLEDEPVMVPSEDKDRKVENKAQATGFMDDGVD